jgi:hypothetical protein
VRLARVTSAVEEAANRLRKLDNSKTAYGSNSLHVAFAGGLGAKVRNQVVEDVAVVLEAILGRGPTFTEIKGAFGDGDSAA